MKVVLGVSSGRQVIEPFQNPEKQKEDDLRSGYGLGLVDFGELGKLGSPYQASNIPSDQEAYSEVIIKFPSCKPFSSYGDSEKGPKKSEKVFSMAGQHFQALKLGEASL